MYGVQIITSNADYKKTVLYSKCVCNVSLYYQKSVEFLSSLVLKKNEVFVFLLHLFPWLVSHTVSFSPYIGVAIF